MNQSYHKPSRLLSFWSLLFGGEDRDVLHDNPCDVGGIEGGYRLYGLYVAESEVGEGVVVGLAVAVEMAGTLRDARCGRSRCRQPTGASGRDHLVEELSPGLHLQGVAHPACGTVDQHVAVLLGVSGRILNSNTWDVSRNLQSWRITLVQSHASLPKVTPALVFPKEHLSTIMRPTGPLPGMVSTYVPFPL